MSSTAFRTAVRFALAAAVTIATLSGCAASPGGSGSAADTPTPATSASAPASIDLSVPLHRLETEHEARIGVSAVDTGTGQTISYRAEERFGYASSLKAFVAAGFLSAVPAQKREQVTTWTQEDVDAAGYSPVTSAHVDDGLTLTRLAEAAVRDSDNTATNLILEKLGGPAALQGILRGVGDD
ncbi:MAG: serine hydrolase, partial [Microbacterium sp.]